MLGIISTHWISPVENKLNLQSTNPKPWITTNVRSINGKQKEKKSKIPIQMHVKEVSQICLIVPKFQDG